MGAGTRSARGRRGPARAAPAPPPPHADPGRARTAARAWRQPRPRVVGADDHRPRPQAVLRCLIEEVILDIERKERRAALTMRWRGGAITELAGSLPCPQPTIRTDENTIALLGRLAVHYPDVTIAAILNRQGRRSATGERFTAIIVGGLRHYRDIPAYTPPTELPDGELLFRRQSRRTNSASPLPPCTAGSKPASSPANRTCPAPPGASASTTSSAHCLSKTHPRRLRADCRRYEDPRRLPPDRVAACQARRARRAPRPQRTPKRPADPGPRSQKRPLRHHPMNEMAV
jgi:hypothetical protein